MKIAFTTTGTNLNAALDPSFGRAENFIIFDLESEDFTLISNTQNITAAQGAGIQAGQTIAKSGAHVLVTGHCGPKAFRALKAAGIKIYNSNDKTVAEALANYRSGGLTEAQSANVEGHWV